MPFRREITLVTLASGAQRKWAKGCARGKVGRSVVNDVSDKGV